MTDATVRCAVEGCGNHHRPDQAMCGYHWRRVSGTTRRRVWRLYESRPGSGEHLEALAEALQEAAS